MIKHIKRTANHVLFFAAALSLAACLEEPTAEVRTADQLFRPINLMATVNGGTVDFSWIPIKNASYSLEVSRDSFQFQRELQVIPLDSTTSHIVENLWSQSRYSARIKAVSKDPAIKDSQYQNITFITGIENIFYPVLPAAVTPTKVSLTWDSTRTVTRLRVLLVDKEVSIVQLTPADIAAGSKTITGLLPVSKYVFQIYNGDMLRGSATVTTLAGP